MEHGRARRLYYPRDLHARAFDGWFCHLKGLRRNSVQPLTILIRDEEEHAMKDEIKLKLRIIGQS
jgi:hypothetical protein